MAELHEEDVWHLPYTAEQIQAATGKSPIISDGKNGNWLVWDIEQMKYVDTGVRAFIGNIDEAVESADRAEAAAAVVAENVEIALEAAKKSEDIFNRLKFASRGSWLERNLFRMA